MIKSYQTYRASGEKWLGDTPAHWKISSLRSQLTELRLKNTGLQSENYLSLVAGRGVMLYAEKGDIGNKKPDDLEKCKIV
jgi:type I restriction enzyme S subunit